MKDLYTENYESLLREFGKDTKKWKDIPCSWVGRINIIKMNILPRAIYRFNAIPIKIPTTFFRRIEQMLQMFIWNQKRPRIAKTILRKKNRTRGITLPDRKLYYRPLSSKLLGTGTWIDTLTSGIELRSQKWAPHLWHLIFDWGAQTIKWGKQSLFNKWC